MANKRNKLRFGSLHPVGNWLIKYAASALRQKNEVHGSGISIKQMLMEMIQATVPIFFNFNEIGKMKKVGPKTMHF